MSFFHALSASHDVLHAAQPAETAAADALPAVRLSLSLPLGLDPEAATRWACCLPGAPSCVELAAGAAMRAIDAPIGCTRFVISATEEQRRIVPLAREALLRRAAAGGMLLRASEPDGERRRLLLAKLARCFDELDAAERLCALAEGCGLGSTSVGLEAAAAATQSAQASLMALYLSLRTETSAFACV
jgi:hypothetical protein